MSLELTRAEQGNPRAKAPDPARPPVEIVRPVREISPVIFASPHSGRTYTDDFLAQSAMSLSNLRRSEDAYVDELMAAAPQAGATLVLAQFPRVFVDPNRSEDEIDPVLTGGRPDPLATIRSPRANAGLGIIPRLGADGMSIHRDVLKPDEVTRRIAQFHAPYHAALEKEVARILARFGHAIVIDMHSMPSISAPGLDAVIGDRHGISCAPAISDTVESALQREGLRTRRNVPYAGAFTTERYGRPALHRHAIQIEINRGLYLDEERVTRSGTFDALKTRLTGFIDTIVKTDWSLKLS